jgi:hypothetical protein
MPIVQLASLLIFSGYLCRSLIPWTVLVCQLAAELVRIRHIFDLHRNQTLGSLYPALPGCLFVSKTNAVTSDVRDALAILLFEHLEHPARIRIQANFQSFST